MPTIAESMRIVKVQVSRENKNPQYRITLPKDIVDKYDMKKGMELVILDDNGVIKLIPRDKIKIAIMGW
ncbi:hypothetical protein DRP04_07230 [Archaeoglobales archaeon]|nr:MAG: hypothetical protein DRP04_07230 [Archaeoglobales archaeon]